MTPDTDRVLFAFALTLLAGLATGVGSAVAFFTRRSDYRVLSFALGFSAGAMLFISFTEILGKADSSLREYYGAVQGGWIMIGAFFAGILIILVIDRLIPQGENPHVPRLEHDLDVLKHGEPGDLSHSSPLQPGEAVQLPTTRLLRMGLFAALAITLHNFPEGMATFLAALEDPGLGLMIAVAIALHNIPEGISVSVPLFYATGSRRKAFLLATLSGLAEPAGAAIGYLLLRPYLTPALMGILFAMIAGIMVFIALDELLPAAREYGRGHQAVYGTISGMAVMAMSLVLFR